MPNQTVDLLNIPQFRSKLAATLVYQILKLHQEVRLQLEASNAEYRDAANQHRCIKEFMVGDLVMIYLRKKRFQACIYHKLQAKKIGPCLILQKFGKNAYKVEFPAELCISNTLNIAAMFWYHPPNAAP